MLNTLAPSDNLKIESVELFSRDNAREHRTDRYEMVFDNGRVTNDQTFG
jgi:transglutaminase 1